MRHQVGLNVGQMTEIEDAQVPGMLTVSYATIGRGN